ncbi:hypothetical protein [Gordoniibacillus kamchatkensis]|uniref:hypothetical protein n=1 Tax=Gordoniibacillus kamchatkensis TaxID=1590651 RepID=UPI000696CA3B|nr:hypothetical protein [Paenibacillus sp. VKM B-2647]
MSEQHIREKKALERAAIRTFLQLYNERFEPKFRLLYQQEKPDAVLENRQRGQLGLEITHLFYDAHEAKRTLGRTDEPRREPETIETWLAELNERIRTKEEKFAGYSHKYPLSLLIRNASPEFGLAAVGQWRERIVKPRELFERIWFLSRDGGPDWHLLELKELLLFTKK